jgi:hypothetical protein
LPTLAGRVMQLLPLGDQVVRAGWASAVAAAAAAGLVAALALALLGRERRVPSVLAGVAFGLSPAVWAQAVRPEVYALAGALALAGTWSALRYLVENDPRRLYVAALAFGLALATHHFVAALAFLPVAGSALARRPRARTLLVTAGFGLLALAVLLYLPLRAAADPLVNWGDPRTLGRFLWVISARAFQKSVGGASDFVLGEELGETTSAVALAVGPAGIVLALLGGYLVVRRGDRRLAGAALLGVVTLGIVGRALLGFDFDNPDAYGYLVPALGAAVVLAAAGIAAIADLAGRWRGVVLVTALAWPASLLAGGLPARNPRGAEEWAHAVLDPLPPRTLLVTSYNETTFLLWGLAAVENLRPDVTVVDRNLLTHEGMAGTWGRREPELLRLLDAPLVGGLPTPVAELDRLAAARPVAFELAVNLDERDPVIARLVPWGAIAWYRVTPIDRDAAEREDDARASRLAAELSAEHGAHRVFVWNQWLTARFYCAQGRREAGLRALARAQAAAGGAADPERDAVCAP